MVKPPDASAAEAMRLSNHTPAGGRSIEKAADTMSGGIQATRKKLPQLLPDGLTPEMHLQAAMTVQNPLTYEASTTIAVRYALKNSPESFNETMRKRTVVAGLLRQLAEACDEENNDLLELCEPSVSAVLKAFGPKNVVPMRELAYVCRT